ncbi:hypothetical protein DFH09DRAFT_1372758 [Mycena vulgaris]|nr:hypothetical protein DFH09DRAFT_1372758 [Mycena vulgaris]
MCYARLGHITGSRTPGTPGTGHEPLWALSAVRLRRGYFDRIFPYSSCHRLSLLRSSAQPLRPMLSSKFSALSLFYTIVALSGIVRGEEVTRTLVAPAIGITSVSVLGVKGDETTFALYQTADDGATTFIQTMVADATNIADVFPAPSFFCDFHETAKGKMQCIEADATSTAYGVYGSYHAIYSTFSYRRKFAPHLIGLAGHPEYKSGYRSKFRLRPIWLVPRACLEELYGIPSTPPQPAANLFGVSGFQNGFTNERDLKPFLETYRPDMNPNTTFDLITLDGGINNQRPADAGIFEGVDIQYAI